MGTLEVTSSAGIADFSQLALDLPATGYTLRFSAPGSTEVISDPFDVIPAKVTVAPFFPINGTNFMDYIPRLVTTRLHQQLDQPVSPQVYYLHGGEIRKILLPELSKCEGLSIEETLDDLKWYCDERNDETYFYSRGFKDGKGLRDLLNAASFKANKVTIKKQNLIVAESTLVNTWWTNPVVPLTLNSGGADPVLTLNSSGTIYTVSASGTSRGIHLSGARVGLVTLGDSTVISNTGTLASFDCLPSTGPVEANCFIGASNVSAWLEVKVNMTLGLRALYIGEGSFFNSAYRNRVHNSELVTTHANSYSIYIQAQNFVMTDSKVTTSGLAGIYHDSGYLSVYDNILISGGTFGLSSGSSAWYSIMNRISIENSGFHGFSIAGFHKTILNSKSFNNVNAGIQIASSSSSTIQNSIFTNNGTSGVELAGMTNAFISGNSAEITFENKLILDNNITDCSITTTGANPSLIDGTCDNQGASTATKITTVNTSSYWNGLVTDSVNTHITGSQVANTITDWRRFENRFRTWVRSLPSEVGRCVTTNTCRIFDFSLSVTATEALFANGTPLAGNTCPASINGSQSQRVNGIYSLKNAMEIFGDFVGNDNGFCESGEDCLYKPHIGPYQGDETTNMLSCNFVDGTNLTDITIYYYPEN